MRENRRTGPWRPLTAPRGRLGPAARSAAAKLAPAIAAAFLAAAALAGCSTAPKDRAIVFETKNKAAEFAKLGDGFMATGQYETALGYYDQALRASHSVDDLEGAASVRSSIGRAYAQAGMEADAKAAFEASLEAALMAGSASAEAVALSGMGELLYAGGETEKALALFEKAAARAAPGGRTPKDEASAKAFAVALHDMAVAHAALDLKAEAYAELDRALGLNLKARRWIELAANRYVLASLLAADGGLEEALAAALSALEADKAAENGRGIAGDLAAAGALAERLGRSDDAFGYWKRSFDAALAVDEAEAARAALEALVRLAGSLDRPGEAARYATLLAKLDEAERGR